MDAKSYLLLLGSDRTDSGIGLPTVWQRFCEDILGVRAVKLKNEGTKEFDQNPEKLKELSDRFRLVSLEKKPSVGSNFVEATVEHMERNDILPEFVLIGIKNEQTGKTDWQAFLGTEMSEPFHAAKIVLKYNRHKEELKEHSEWFDKVWYEDERARQLTRGFLKVMTSDAKIRKEDLEKDPDLKVLLDMADEWEQKNSRIRGNNL